MALDRTRAHASEAGMGFCSRLSEVAADGRDQVGHRIRDVVHPLGFVAGDGPQAQADVHQQEGHHEGNELPGRSCQEGTGLTAGLCDHEATSHSSDGKSNALELLNYNTLIL